jgi:hypothetical protein
MRARVPWTIRCALCASVVLFAQAAQAQSDESLAGRWRAGATSMEVLISSWGKDCGPRPQSTRSAGGGSVELEQQAQVVTIRGADRDLRSDQCWSPNRALRKLGSSYAAGVWTTRCKTAENDPRQESGTYSLRLIDSGRLLYQDVSHFDWKLKDSTCVASITTTQTLIRASEEQRTKASGAAPAAQAPATSGQCRPGPAKRIVVRPRSADIELGQSLCFQARVLDAVGCRLEAVEPRWSLEHAPGLKAEVERGCFRAGQSSAEAEGTFKVIASHGGLRAEATLHVSAVSLPALLAKRLETGAVTGEALPEAESPPAQSTTRVAAKAIKQTKSNRRRWLVALSALLVAAAAILLLLRTRPRPRARSAARGSARSSSDRLHDVTRESPSPRARIRRCPTCGASYSESSAFCGTDGSALSAPE